MMTFFHPVSTFSNTGKSAKGRALQEMALKFDRLLIQGDNSAVSLTVRMREIAAVLDARYPRARPTFVECHIDDNGCGMISACPTSDNARGILNQDYFRITFNSVAHVAIIDEVIDNFTLDCFEKGGEL